MLYVWCSHRSDKKGHIVGRNGRTLCQVENSGATARDRLDSRGEILPEPWKLCGVCRFLRPRRALWGEEASA